MKKKRWQRIKSGTRYYEWLMFDWYMRTGQLPQYALCKEQVLALKRFYKNLDRHTKHNSLYMQRWRHLQGAE